MKYFAPPALSVKFTATLLALGTLGTVCTSQAGFLDILRGEPQPARQEYQRVAFVGSATVKEISGRAERLQGIDEWKPLMPGAELLPGDLLRTSDGSVLLRMNESGSFVQVTPHTVLRLVNYDQEWDRGVLTGREEKSGFVVRSCRGKAYMRSAGEKWTPIEVNSVLAAGTEIRSERGTVLDLFHTEKQTPVRIRGESMFKLQEKLLAKRVLKAPTLVAVSQP